MDHYVIKGIDVKFSDLQDKALVKYFMDTRMRRITMRAKIHERVVGEPFDVKITDNLYEILEIEIPSATFVWEKDG